VVVVLVVSRRGWAYLCMCASASLRQNISETKGYSGLFPIVSLQENVQGESSGLPMTSSDQMASC